MISETYSKNKRLMICLTVILLVAGTVFFLSVKKQPAPDRNIRPIGQVQDLDPLIDRARQADYVLLGESSHGTSEYYSWRAEISRRLISEHGFSFLAVEGDWDALYEINLYVRHLLSPAGGARQIMSGFDRWPTWMWANEEFLEFVEWLREYNYGREASAMTGVYGQDIYGAFKSMPAVINFLEDRDPEFALTATASYACLLQYDGNISAYVEDIYHLGKDCRQELALVLDHLEKSREAFDILPGSTEEKAYFNALQNARVAVHAEEHYRYNLLPGQASWNARVMGMKSIFNHIAAHKGQEAKGIVWAHNTHVGDARATEMADSGAVNIGQLLREKLGPDRIFIIGFGSNRGTVLAGYSWGSPAQIMDIPPAPSGSLENLLAGYDRSDFWILLSDDYWQNKLSGAIGHRAKGVVYDPAGDHRQYVSTFVPDRYDAFIFFEQTTALRALGG